MTRSSSVNWATTSASTLFRYPGRTITMGRWDDVVVSAFLATGGRRRQLTVAGDAVTPDSRDGLRERLAEVAAMEFSLAVAARQS